MIDGQRLSHTKKHKKSTETKERVGIITYKPNYKHNCEADTTYFGTVGLYRSDVLSFT